MPDPTVVLVGHCGPDMFMLQGAIQRTLPGVPIETVNSETDLSNWSHPAAIWLVNRVLDGAFPTESGIELIGRYAKLPTSPATMLVSNFADAQESAIAAGALPGFGKSDLYDAIFAERLQAAAGASA